eukprot:9176457-Alexandrium_andersonii.AAC.1
MARIRPHPDIEIVAIHERRDAGQPIGAHVHGHPKPWPIAPIGPILAVRAVSEEGQPSAHGRLPDLIAQREAPLFGHQPVYL